MLKITVPISRLREQADDPEAFDEKLSVKRFRGSLECAVRDATSDSVQVVVTDGGYTTVQASFGERGDSPRIRNIIDRTVRNSKSWIAERKV